MAKKAAEGKQARRQKGPLETPLERRPLGNGLLYDMRPEWDLKAFQKVVAFAEQAGIDAKSEHFCCELAWYLLRKHEPAFRPEPRGRHAAAWPDVRAARRKLIELYIAENAPRIEKGSKPLSDKAFVDKLLTHTGRSKLPPYYRTKPKLGERMLRQELRDARGELAIHVRVLALSSEGKDEIIKQYGLNEVALSKAARFAALDRPKRAGRKLGRD
jgi:hypothetical protein